MFANFGAPFLPSFPPKYTTEKEKNFPDEWKKGISLLFLFLRFFCFLFFLRDFGMCGEVERSDASAAVLFFIPAFLFRRSGKEIALCGENKISVRLRKESLQFFPSLLTFVLIHCWYLAYKCSEASLLSSKNIFVELIFPPVFAVNCGIV